MEKETNIQIYNLLAPENEYIDPTPDLQAMFLEYNELFFGGKLSCCEVKWSKRMTLCAGLCSYQPRSGFCSIRLSEPLLKLRPRSDFINTLLHEMIHAYLFVASAIRDREDHGPLFQALMHSINRAAGTNITIYHTFRSEVDSYRTHWWQCNGPCRHKPPYFGLVKRSMNRPPGPSDTWYADHQKKCGGKYTKIKEPCDYKSKGKAKALKKEQEERSKSSLLNSNIRKYFFPPSTDAHLNDTSPDSAANTAIKSSESDTSHYYSKKVETKEEIDQPSTTEKKRNKVQTIISIDNINSPVSPKKLQTKVGNCQIPSPGKKRKKIQSKISVENGSSTNSPKDSEEKEGNEQQPRLAGKKRKKIQTKISIEKVENRDAKTLSITSGKLCSNEKIPIVNPNTPIGIVETKTHVDQDTSKTKGTLDCYYLDIDGEIVQIGKEQLYELGISSTHLPNQETRSLIPFKSTLAHDNLIDLTQYSDED